MYAIAIYDDDEFGNTALAYWTTRCMDTDNYTYDVEDATRFASKSAARSLIHALGLEDGHQVVAI